MEDFCEAGRGFRQRKKATAAETICPICEVTLKSSDLENHYQLEVDRLIKLQLNSKTKKNISNGNVSYHEPTTSTSISPSNGNSDENSMNVNANDSTTVGCPWIKFQKIRSNRHQRLKIKNKKRKIDDPICPICNEQPLEDINIHVEMCLRKIDHQNKSNGSSSTAVTSDDDDESIDIEGETETYEEYEWAGQKRIRVSSLLEGGYSSLGIGSNVTASTDNNDDEDEDLNVDGDLDTQIYGASQYTEKDVIVPLSDCENGNNENTSYLRQLVAGESGVNQQQQIQDDKHNSDNLNGKIKSEKINTTITNNKIYNGSSSPSTSSSLPSGSNFKNSNQIIESLKLKIIELEQVNNKNNNKVKCLICMDEFHNPAVSICCWHVHCEECWLRTLGSRKLCPQCNMITSPKDLRRIYM